MGRNVCIVTGAAGQDGWFLTRHLLREGSTVIACVRAAGDLEALRGSGDLQIVTADLLACEPLLDLVRRTRPAEFYNLAGMSSVARSMAAPDEAWQSIASFVERLLDTLRRHSPDTRFYQASSTEMFGGSDDPAVVFDERSPLAPRSPYAASKAAAQMLCRAYRETYGLRVACGILSNHESIRRPAGFLTSKIAAHVAQLAARGRDSVEPLRAGNVLIERDWGAAEDYTEGIVRVARQTAVRGVEDEASAYREYILSTGHSTAVWQMIDRAFALAGMTLRWELDSEDPAQWRALFEDGSPAVLVDAALVRRFEPRYLRSDPTRARVELGWSPRRGVDAFLAPMIAQAGARIVPGV